MKTFAALSLTAAAACAVDMVVENPYMDLFGAGDNMHAVPTPGQMFSEPTVMKQEPEPSVKVNVWDTIATELEELMTEIVALTDTADIQGMLLKNTQTSFGILMGEVESLRMTNTSNRMDMAAQDALDARQDSETDKISNEVKVLERDANKLNNSVALLKLRFAQLPDLSMLTAHLNTIIDTNVMF